MKILIKKSGILKLRRRFFLILSFLPAVILFFTLCILTPAVLNSMMVKENGNAPTFTFKVPEKTAVKSETMDRIDRDGEIVYEKELLPENIFPLSTPDPEKVYYEVKETNASRSADSCGISVNDSTNSDTDLKAIREGEFSPDFSSYKLFSGEPLVLIYHTHTCESYEESFRTFYYEDDIFRTEDKEKNVCAVGEAMKKVLEENGIAVIHDTTYHDTPAFNGAYSRSKETALYNLEKYPSIKITIDLHRDAMITDEGLSYKPTTKINGKKAAQMMIIAGCDVDNELGYDNWLLNLPFSLQIQKTAESMYPGLMRPLMFCNRSYNMGLTNTSFLVEVGTQSNTLSEAVYSGRLMGNILSEVIIGNLS